MVVQSTTSLIYATQKLRHYLIGSKVQLIMKEDPIRFLCMKPALAGRAAKWLLQLSEFDITCIAPKAIKGQAVADLLAAFLGEEGQELLYEVPGEIPEIATMTLRPWNLSFDGSSTKEGEQQELSSQILTRKFFLIHSSWIFRFQIMQRNMKHSC